MYFAALQKMRVKNIEPTLFGFDAIGFIAKGSFLKKKRCIDAKKLFKSDFYIIMDENPILYEVAMGKKALAPPKNMLFETIQIDILQRSFDSIVIAVGEESLLRNIVHLDF